jgi:thiamine pyrophosphate-dependent acetolactate synthase large subunit-like protein
MNVEEFILSGMMVFVTLTSKIIPAMKETIKQELHQLVDKCDNELLLEEARELLQSKKDWWNELSENDKNLLSESEAQYNKGEFVNHQELMQRFEEWKKK